MGLEQKGYGGYIGSGDDGRFGPDQVPRSVSIMMRFWGGLFWVVALLFACAWLLHHMVSRGGQGV